MRQPPGSTSAVERSLEDFIARANTTLPSAPPPRRPAASSTLVVLGPRGPLAEETEIVTRLSPEELAGARPRSWFSARLGLAFVAGAALVLLATRLISGGPTPVLPVAPAAAEPAQAPAPMPLPMPIVVQPIPPAELPAAAPAPAAVSEPAAPAEPASRPARATRKAIRAAPAAPRPRPAPASDRAGLVDPFAP
jgi:DamX protein